MAVELIFRTHSFVTQLEENSIQNLIGLLSDSQQQKLVSADINVNMNESKKIMSLTGQTRTGHARFRRAPVPVSVAPVTKVYSPTPIQQILPPAAAGSEKQEIVVLSNNGVLEMRESSMHPKRILSFSSAISHENSLISGDTESKNFHVSAVGKIPLSCSSLKRKCSSSGNGVSGKCNGSSGRCHCFKKRKLRLKKVVRVPAISVKIADIPNDDYSWRKYGQKHIKCSPYPRSYYKCSTIRDCPGRKHVERAIDDPSILIVTYEGEHNHSISVTETNSFILESS